MNPYQNPPPGNIPPAQGGGFGPPQGGYGPPQGGSGPPQGGYGPPQGGAFGPPQGPPPKKGMSGCLLAFLIVLGLFLVGGGIAGFLIWRALGGFMGAAKDAVTLAQEAQHAPGTTQLRGLGCEDAMAMDGKKLLAIGQRFEDEVAKKQDRKPKKLEEKGVNTYVYCKNSLGDPPTCDKVAQTYVKAASPTEPFVVSVQEMGSNSCSGSYSADGKRVGDATAPSVPGQDQ